jgi:acetyl-CoA C-acetyltransferase
VTARTPQPGADRARPGGEQGEVVVVAAKRTPIGRFLGSLEPFTAVDLGTIAARAVLLDLADAASAAGGSVPRISRLVFGCARQAGVGPNPARQVALHAGLGQETVAHTVNMACASGLEAIVQAARLIRSKEADWVLAGGTESMSRIPFLLDRFRGGYRMGDGRVVDAMYKDGFLCPLAEQLMGATAETLARRYAISRQEQDAYALESQRRAASARADLGEEIIPVPASPAGSSVGPPRGSEPAGPPALEEDEHPRPRTTMEDLSRLAPVFAADGTVTAGNASGITDGAAALILTRASEAESLGVPVLARLTAWESAGVDPRVMGIAPVPAVRALLGRTGLTLADIDLCELNEAFAAQVLAVDRELGFDRSRLNVHGGAIALGHPIGCSGARIVVTLLHAMRRRRARRGLATLCVSGGLGLAALVERP